MAGLPIRSFVVLVTLAAALVAAIDRCRAQDQPPNKSTSVSEGGYAKPGKVGAAGKKKEPTPFVADDCPPATKFVNAETDGATRYCVFAEQKSLKRCETSYFNYIQRDQATKIGFDFRIDSGSWDFHDMWTSIFQIHSKPDPGEQWRCPIAMLAVRGHSLEMWDRDDPERISVTTNGTCAGEGNSIHSHDIFAGVPVTAGEWNYFDLQTNLSLGPAGTLSVSLNKRMIGSLSGPNTYNDQSRPFVKIGIYKPSPWLTAKRLCVDYRDVIIKSGGD